MMNLVNIFLLGEKKSSAEKSQLVIRYNVTVVKRTKEQINTKGAKIRLKKKFKIYLKAR